jgi:hypothetical protein
MSILVNADGVHVLARKWKISTRSGHPSEWFGAFCDHRCYIVLHLKDGTRLYGWPSKWPSDASAGHFFLTDVVRIAHGIEQPLPMLNGILIDVKDVSSVEFVRQSQETTDDQANQPTEPAKPTSSREEGTSKREPSGELHAAADPAISAN